MAWIIGIGVALFLLFAFPRQMIGLVVLLATLGGGLWIYNDQSTKAQEAEEARVLLEARYDTTACPTSHPVWVSFRNGAERTINSVTFSIQGYRPRHSQAEVSNSYLDSDRIIAPGESYAGCWSAKSYGAEDVPTGLDWKAPLISVRFAHE